MSFKQKSTNKQWWPGKKEKDLSHHNNHYCSAFDVIKVNNYGKRQQRTIAVSSQGVSNLNGPSCQWFVKNSDVYSIDQDNGEPQKFTLTFLHKYHFEAESSEQAKLIVAEFRRLGVGCKASIATDTSSTSSSPTHQHTRTLNDNSIGSSSSSSSVQSSPRVSPNVSPQLNSSNNPQLNRDPLYLSSTRQGLGSNLGISKLTQSSSNIKKDKEKEKEEKEREKEKEKEKKEKEKEAKKDLKIITPNVIIDKLDTNNNNNNETMGLSPLTPTSYTLHSGIPGAPGSAGGMVAPNTPNAFSSDGARVWKIRAEELKRQLISKKTDQIPLSASSIHSQQQQHQQQLLINPLPSKPMTNDEIIKSTMNDTDNNNNNNKVNIEFEYDRDEEEEEKKKKKKNRKKFKIDDFDLLKVLGVGSFGRVFLVRKKDTQVMYAMKVLNKRDMMKKKQIAHTNTEKMVLSTMDHPFIVQLHFAFQNEEYLFMCMDYIPGGELFHHLQKAGRFPEELAKFYIAEVITSLEYLHSNDIIYRDIKPENILLDADGHIKLTDFGLSKSGITSVVGKCGEGQFATTFCGTPEYLAPEIITGAGHGKAADWWSVGILLFEMLTGRSPFLATNRNDMYKAMIQGNLRLPMFLSSDAQDLLGKLLVPDPKKRLGSGGVKEIQNHPFFELIPWRMLESKMITPPFKPTIKEYNPANHKEDPDLNPAITFQRRRSSSTVIYDSPFKNFSWNKEEDEDMVLNQLNERASISSSASSPSSPPSIVNPSPLHRERKSTLKSIRKGSI